MHRVYDKSMKPSRPLLRFFGGKWRRLARWIVSYFPEHRIYTESYGGAVSVLLWKPRSYAEIINDLDSELVNLFRVLRDPASARELERLLRLTPFDRAAFEAAYLPASDPIEQARRLVIRSFMGFGSPSYNSSKKTGFRANSHRNGTTVSHDWASYPDALAAITSRTEGYGSRAIRRL